jgi:hypothetical protein
MPCPGRITRQDRSQVGSNVRDLARLLRRVRNHPRGVGGWCDHKHRRIVVDAGAPPDARLRIVIHETAHALGIDYQTHTREQAGVMVDIVCAGLGLAIDGESIP